MERIIYTGKDFCAVEEDGLLVEYLHTEEDSQSGDIIAGTVERIMPGLECAFVDIGRRQNGFLPMKENSLTFCGASLRSGMRIAVQIRKEETSSKGAYLTRDFAIPGTYILLMPYNRYIGVSSRISDEQARERLRTYGQLLTSDEHGIVFRESSLQASLQCIADEYRVLMQKWADVSEKMKNLPSNGFVLYHADPVQQLISDYQGKGPVTVINTEVLPTNLDRQRRQSSERLIRIRNGGNIVIDRCEAMTVIDVNTGSAAGDHKKSFLITETNISACESIASQIRLRDLGGIILIDFIDMESDEERCIVEQRLRDCLTRDRRKTVIHGWTKLGIMEMTRKRTGK